MVSTRFIVRRAVWGVVVSAWALAVIGVTTIGAPQPVAADGNEAPLAPVAYRALTAGWEESCAILVNGSIRCWGSNTFGALGQGDTASRGDGANEMAAALPAVDLGTGRTAAALSAGFGDNCALLDNATVKCWGLGTFGQLGQGDANHRGDGAGEMGDSLPAINVGTGRTVTAVTAGFGHTCARLDNASVKCWGENNKGQLGQGDTSNRGDNAGEMGNRLGPVPLAPQGVLRDGNGLRDRPAHRRRVHRRAAHVRLRPRHGLRRRQRPVHRGGAGGGLFLLHDRPAPS